MSVGTELAAARQALGLSVEEVAARTKVTSERLRAIEQMGGLWLPSRVHLQGFVRAYAAAVRLDPDAIAQRYVAELGVAASDTAPASGGAVPGASEDSALDEFSSESGANNDLFVSEDSMGRTSHSRA
jgi:cytoskeletal protein RodZ